MLISRYIYDGPLHPGASRHISYNSLISEDEEHPKRIDTRQTGLRKMSSSGKDLRGEARTGFEGNLTSQQAACLEELRRRVLASTYKEDFEREVGGDKFLLQFLRATMKDKTGARVFQTDVAEKRLFKAFDWRREIGAFEILQNVRNGGPKPDKYELFSSLYPSMDIVNEKTGQLVHFLRFGRFVTTVDPNALTVLEWSRCFCHELFCLQERLRELSQIHGREISTYYVYTDIMGISLFAMANKLSFVKMMSAVASDNFPEMLDQTFLVNAPSIVPAIFNLVKPLIDKDILSKFIISSDCATPSLSKIIPLESIPKEFGGTSEVVFPKVLADREKA